MQGTCKQHKCYILLKHLELSFKTKILKRPKSDLGHDNI